MHCALAAALLLGQRRLSLWQRLHLQRLLQANSIAQYAYNAVWVFRTAVLLHNLKPVFLPPEHFSMTILEPPRATMPLCLALFSFLHA